MRMLEKVMDLVRRGINEERKEQRRKGDTDRMVDASVGVWRHCVNGTRATNRCQI
jgi:hypothetical protein